MKRIESYDDLPEWIKKDWPTPVEEYTELKEGLESQGIILREATEEQQQDFNKFNQGIKNLIFSFHGIGAGAYIFTDEETNELEKILSDGRRGVAEEAISAFMFELQGLTSQKKYEILDTAERAKKADMRATRQKIIDDGNSFLKHLEGIVSCQRQWVTHNDLEPEGDITYPIEDDDEFIDGRFSNPVTHIKFKVWGLADKIRGPMQEMVKALEKFQENESKKQSRPPADADNFVSLIAEAYGRHIVRPTRYPDGPFFKIVEYIYDILEIKNKKKDGPNDPTRAIAKALERLKK